MNFEFEKDNLLDILRNPDDSRSESESSTSVSESQEDTETEEEIIESAYLKNVEKNKAKLKNKKTSQNEIEKYKKKLGLNASQSMKPTPKKDDSQTILLDFEEPDDRYPEKPVDVARETEIFTILTYPSLARLGAQNLRDNADLIEVDDSGEFEKITKSKIQETISNLSFSVDKKKQVSLIKKLKTDIIFDYQRSQKKKKSNLYTDLGKLSSLQIFSIRWRNIILMDPNVEMPFIYLQSVQTGGVGAVKIDYYSNILMLEAYGMTTQIIYEGPDCCKYRAFFSGKVPDKKKDNEENIIQTMIHDRNLDSKKTEKYHQGGLSASSIDQLLKKNVEKPDYQYSEQDRIQQLKGAQKRAASHEQPLEFFNIKKKPIDEKTKVEKKKDTILKIEFQINRKADDYQEDENEDENDLEESESTSEKVTRYDKYLNGFTQNMLDSLVQNCQFINEQSIEAIARKSTEISAWIENYLCIDVCIFPGVQGANDEQIERQLLFVFNVCTQNPYTFLLHNIGKSERNEILRKNQQINSAPTGSSTI